MPDSALPHWPNVNAIVAEAKAWYDQTKVKPAEAKADAAKQTANDYVAVSTKGIFVAMWTKLGGRYANKFFKSERVNFVGCLAFIAFGLIYWAIYRDPPRKVALGLLLSGIIATYAIVSVVIAEIRFQCGKRAAIAEWQRLNNAIPDDGIETKVQMYLGAALRPELDYFRTSKLATDRNQRLGQLDLSIEENGKAAPAARALTAALDDWKEYTYFIHEEAKCLQRAIEDAARIVRHEAAADAYVDEEDFDSEDLRARLRRLLPAMNNVRQLLVHAKNASQIAAGDGGLESALASDDWRAIQARF